MRKQLLISEPNPGGNIFLMGKSCNMDHEKSNVLYTIKYQRETTHVNAE